MRLPSLHKRRAHLDRLVGCASEFIPYLAIELLLPSGSLVLCCSGFIGAFTTDEESMDRLHPNDFDRTAWNLVAMTLSLDNLRTAATRRDKRTEALFTTLLRLPGYLSEWGMSKPARETARRLCDFFDSEIDRHRNEQEARLFPPLLASVQDGDIAVMRDRIATFTAEHRALEHAWKKLRPRLAAVGSAPRVRIVVAWIEIDNAGAL
jgi:hypothetical protein